jgi:sporulation protein YlmC with PRC-barrel domain
MNKSIAALVIAGLTFATFSSAGFAQGAPQTISRVDVTQIATGFRASKISGSAVRNDNGDSIGTVDDTIIGSDDGNIYAILSVGGFLGMGAHLIAVPFKSLTIQKDRIILPGATKDQLRALAEFKYTTD